MSVQNLSEFISGATRKLNMAADDVLGQAELFARIWPVFDLTPAIVLEAGRGMRDHRMSFYDAQVWAAARLNRAPVIFSQDFPAGAYQEGVRFVDPFASDFDLALWAV